MMFSQPIAVETQAVTMAGQGQGFGDGLGAITARTNGGLVQHAQC